MLVNKLVILLIVSCMTIGIGSAALILPGPQYHPVGWDHDGLIIPPGWLNVYDDNIRYEYWGNVIVITPGLDYVGSLYAYSARSPWMVIDNHGMPIMSGGPNAPWPVNMQFTYYRWNG